jgi:hypothetical protein
MATIAGAGGCSGCDKGSGSAVNGGATIPPSSASPSARAVASTPGDDAGVNDRCVESDAPLVLDKSIRLDAGITLVRLTDGRIAVGWATGEGTPKAAVADATGKLTLLEVDASGIPELATKVAPKTLRSILRVTPFAPEGAAPRVRVAVDLLEVAADKTRWLRCGASDKKPLFEFKGKSAYDGATEGAAGAEIRECRTYVDGDREWAMASELRKAEAADGYEARWLVGARASDPAAATTLMPPIETRKIEAQKDNAVPRADRHVFEVPVASATPGGFVVASRYNGQIVIGRLSASLAPEGKAVGHWLGVPTGTPALATRVDPAGTEASTSLVAAALGKADLYAAEFPSAPGKPPPMPAIMAITEPAKPGSSDASTATVERTAISATFTNHGNLVVGYALGTPAKKRARLAIVNGPRSLGPAIEVAESDHVPELRVIGLGDGRVLVAWAAQKSSGLALTTAVYRCGEVEPLATVLVGDVPGDGGPPADHD